MESQKEENQPQYFVVAPQGAAQHGQPHPMFVNPQQPWPTQQFVPYFVPAPVYSDQSFNQMPAQFVQQQPLITKTAPSKEIQNMGSFFAFAKALLGGFFFPLLSAIVVYSMESTMMSRLGVLFGNGIAFLWTGCYLLSFGIFINTLNNEYDDDYYYSERGHHEASHEGDIFFYISIPLLICAIVFYVAGNRLWKRYMTIYISPAAESERIKVTSRVGTNCQFFTTFLFSFFVPVVGSGLSLMTCRTLKGRYGALVGLSSCFVAIGCAIVPFPYVTAITGNPIMLIGLILQQFAIVHFRRAICSAEIEALTTELTTI